MTSGRIVHSDAFDVDAYSLEGNGIALFAIIKNDVNTLRDVLVACQSRTGSEIIEVVAGARKTKNGSAPLDPIWTPEGAGPRELVAIEGQIRVRLEMEKALNPGLFLDQRLNREELSTHLKDLLAHRSEPIRMLNLFCYTGAFSLSVARTCRDAGHSVELINVDLSKRYLDWLKRNFAHSHGNDPGITTREFAMDARKFLESEVKKRPGTYDVVVIDPPTFSRGGKKPFRVESELPEMVRTSIRLLRGSPGEVMLVSCNDARWETSAFESTLRSLAVESGLRFSAGSFAAAEFGAGHPLKSAFLRRIDPRLSEGGPPKSTNGGNKSQSGRPDRS